MKTETMEISKTECMVCGQMFLFAMEHICSDCEARIKEETETELIEQARADLFDETTNDLPPFFPWGVKPNRGFTAHRL